MVSKELLAAVKQSLAVHYGDRLRGVVLYGSEARGEAGPESDVDLLVLLRGPVDTWREILAVIDVIYPLQLESAFFRPLTVIPIDAEAYAARSTGLLRAAARDGHLL